MNLIIIILILITNFAFAQSEDVIDITLPNTNNNKDLSIDLDELFNSSNSTESTSNTKNDTTSTDETKDITPSTVTNSVTPPITSSKELPPLPVPPIVVPSQPQISVIKKEEIPQENPNIQIKEITTKIITPTLEQNIPNKPELPIDIKAKPIEPKLEIKQNNKETIKEPQVISKNPSIIPDKPIDYNIPPIIKQTVDQEPSSNEIPLPKVITPAKAPIMMQNNTSNNESDSKQPIIPVTPIDIPVPTILQIPTDDLKDIHFLEKIAPITPTIPEIKEIPNPNTIKIPSTTPPPVILQPKTIDGFEGVIKSSGSPSQKKEEKPKTETPSSGNKSKPSNPKTLKTNSSQTPNDKNSNTYEVNLNIDNIWDKTMMFSEDEVEQLKSAMNNFLYGVTELKSDKQDTLLPIKKQKQNVKIALKSILYFSENNWSIWVNNRKINAQDKNNNSSGFHVEKVTPKYVSISLPINPEIMDVPENSTSSLSSSYSNDGKIIINFSPNDKIVKFDLYPNQVFNSSEMAISDGK